MATINPWVEVFYDYAGQTTVTYDWQTGKEYLLIVSDDRGSLELPIIHIRIPFDIPVPTTGVAGMRAAGGWDIACAAEVYPSGLKRFRPVWGDGNVTDRIYQIHERDISPDPNEWSLAPDDDTFLMEEWYTASGAMRSGTITDFQRDYEYLVTLYAPESSSQKYYSCSTFYNVGQAYVDSAAGRASSISGRGFLYWYHKDFAKLSGNGTTGTFSMHYGRSTHHLYKIYRRKIVYDNTEKYNSFNLVAFTGKESGKFTRYLDYDTEYLMLGNDTHADNEYVTGIMRFTKSLETVLDSGKGFFLRLMDAQKMMYDSRSKQFNVIENQLMAIYKRADIEEYSEPEPEPEPDPEPDPEVINCEDQCLALGEKYVTEIAVEVQFNDPPDWAKRGYQYTWTAPSSELSVSSTEQDGRVAIFKLAHKMKEEDAQTLIPYDIRVQVKDLQYTTAGVEDSDEAVLTFEMPCVIVDNETNFSINNVSVAECGAGETDTTATFTITSDEAILGSDVTMDYTITGVEATAGDDFVGGSGTITFSEGETVQTLDVTIKCDDVPEYNETFEVVLSNVSRGSISDNTGVGTIVDNSPNVTKVELASEGEQYNVYIFRDMSGSTSNTDDVTVNGTVSSRDDAIIQILNDYSIPSNRIIGGEYASVSMFTSYMKYVLDSVPTSQKRVSVLYLTDATDGYANTSNFYTYTSPSNDHPTEGGATTTIIAVDDVIADETSTWNSTIGAIPSHIEEMKVTVVRISGSDTWTTTSGMTAEEGYNNILTSAPSKVIESSFESFDVYNTGDSTTVNDRIASAALNTYSAYCTKDPDDNILIQAADENEARDLAEPQLNCPDD